MNKGVIVQLDYDVAHILKNDGTFVSCPRNAGWEVGDIVTLSSRRQISIRILIISCAVFVCLVLLSGAIVYPIPATYIEISVNPSFQLTLNRFNRVLNLTGLDAEGEKIVNDISYKHLTLEEVHARLLNHLENDGILGDATVRLAIANNSQKKIYGIEENLKNTFEKYSQSNVQLNVKRFGKDYYLSLAHPIPDQDWTVSKEPAPDTDIQTNDTQPEDTAPNNTEPDGTTPDSTTPNNTPPPSNAPSFPGVFQSPMPNIGPSRTPNSILPSPPMGMPHHRKQRHNR